MFSKYSATKMGWLRRHWRLGKTHRLFAAGQLQGIYLGSVQANKRKPGFNSHRWKISRSMLPKFTFKVKPRDTDHIWWLYRKTPISYCRRTMWEANLLRSPSNFRSSACCQPRPDSARNREIQLCNGLSCPFQETKEQAHALMEVWNRLLSNTVLLRQSTDHKSCYFLEFSIKHQAAEWQWSSLDCFQQPHLLAIQ